MKEEDPVISLENLGVKVPFLLLHLFQEEKEKEWVQDDRICPTILNPRLLRSRSNQTPTETQLLPLVISKLEGVHSMLQSLKITVQSSRTNLLFKFPCFSGVCTSSVEHHHSKNPTESHRVHKLKGFRGCPAFIRKCIQYGLKSKLIVFSSILFLCFQHEGRKIFT